MYGRDFELVTEFEYFFSYKEMSMMESGRGN